MWHFEPQGPDLNPKVYENAGSGSFHNEYVSATLLLTVQSCGIWQFGTHVYPLLYSSLLTAIVYHAFILLYMDHTGKYEAG
jgi:hypothetical protein